jgi:hypothetical protein
MTYNYLQDLEERSKYADWRYKIMDLPADELLKEIKGMSRETLIGWLSWNDPNGIYTDAASKIDRLPRITKKEAERIMYRQIMSNREGWDGMMDGKHIE